jgi:hypothetical protein
MPVFSTHVKKVVVQPRFPARVTTDAGLQVNVSEGVFTFALDYEDIAPGTGPEVAGTWVAVWDEDLDTYRRVTVAELGAGAGAGFLISANNLSDLTDPAAARNNIGLGNVNNTSDLNKPISTATQAALDVHTGQISTHTSQIAANTSSIALKQNIATLIADVKAGLPYVEGTFLPDLKFGGAAVGLTYASRSGNYTRIGNRVFFDLALTLTSKGSSVGSAFIGGLPIAIASTSIAVAVRVTNFTAGVADGFIQAVIDQGQAAVWMRRISSGGSADSGWTNTDFSNTTAIQVAGHYQC